MELKYSSFLTEIKEDLKLLVKELSKDFPYVSILATDCIGKVYSVTRRTSAISGNDCNERGFVVRIHNDVNYSEYSFNEISKDTVLEIAETIRKDLGGFVKQAMGKLTFNEYERIKEEEMKKVFSKEVKINPKTLKDEEVIKRLTAIMNNGLVKSEKIIDYRVRFEYLHVNKLYLSKNKDLEQSYMWGNGANICIASKDENTKYSYKGFSGLKGGELLEEMEASVELVVNNTLVLLDAEPMPPGEYEVICDPDVTGLIAHEAFGHGVEMDMFLKDRAKSKEYLGEYVASELTVMHDGAKGIEETSSYNFDDEGVLAQDTIIIEEGILKQGISDSLSALSLGVEPTGNGKRESYERKAYTRMTNTYFSPGKHKLEDMIASIDYGFLLEQSASGMEDPKNWGIQCMVNVAKEIKDGKLTGKVYSPVILTGYVPDLLKSISMVSEDLEMGGAGFCGKGYKEWVKVSCGGPYIKARVRLG
ncbi:TldD/PmbA family protein [Clostridium sp. UBA4548]|uniref:TldD/PmbA family protein n=1 Tax=Clostridium sp. UBA4548 TaxID=1946361 RepID=UPI0025C2886B|nr:TldD/PmbA family protein [Clostridium sp. UBA4548]